MTHLSPARELAAQTIDPMYEWARDLFPICRSITGAGTRATLAYIAERLPGLRIESIASGAHRLLS